MDDTAELRLLLTLMLEYAGYCVVEVEHGAAALAALRACDVRPDLILLDLAMPVMNGWTFRQEQRRDPRLAQIPVIVVSAEMADERILALAADGYVRKPFEISEVLQLVATVLERAPPRPLVRRTR